MTVQDLRIKLVDHRGQTVLTFVRRGYLEDDQWNWDDWGVEVKPASEKVRMHPNRPRAVDTGTPDEYLKQLPDGRLILEVPGLTLRWENVTPILDRLAENDIPTLTVDQLRASVR